MAGYIFHVINRGARRGRLFETAAHYEAFERILLAALTERPIRLVNYCVMPNHFHLVCWPETDGQLSRFMHWFTATHAMHWRAASNTVGEGVVYQGRYKAIPVQTEDYFLRLARYVERNPLRANLIQRAEQWRWSSLWHRDVARDNFPLAQWPVARPSDWLIEVNRAQTLDELAAIRRSVNRGCALGNPSWRSEIAKSLGNPGLVGGQGRPRGNGG